MSLILLNIVGAVFLLLWGTLLVRQGFTRAFGVNLRKIIEVGTHNRLAAFASGLGLATLLQSSTATALLAISFAKKGLLGLSLGLALMIGADIGTTLVAQIFVFGLSWLSPALLSLGGFLYLSNKDHTFRRNIARIFIGLGLMLLSLGLVRESAAPLKESDMLIALMSPLKDDPFFAILISAILTWIIHSSLAAVLLFGSFAASGLIDLELGLLLILGANLGGAMIPLVVTFKDRPIARQIALGNLIMRFVTLVLFLLGFSYILEFLQDYIASSGISLDRVLIHTHTGFNIALAVLFLPATSFVAAVCQRLISDTEPNKSKNEPLYLDKAALETPTIALSHAKREVLRMAEIVEQMLDQSIVCFSSHSQDLIREISITDHKVDTLYREIKLYMAALPSEGINGKDAHHYFEILTFATNLEHIGDIIDKSLMELAQKKIRKHGEFSDAGYKEIRDFHKQVVENMRLAQAIFVSGDTKLAGQLAKGKRAIRDAADQSYAKHFRRLEDGKTKSVDTSSIHLDIIRDYRQINNYATRIAYIILNHPDDKV